LAEEIGFKHGWLRGDFGAPRHMWVYVHTKSGRTGLGWFDGSLWTVDGFRWTPDVGYDAVTHWRVVEYPEAP